ncbi:MAG: hypothetical protein IJ532_06945 [Alphaproteobacteria bacterium]|nr:hypothetical protein [Alphaproteobacteria bacterium]
MELYILTALIFIYIITAFAGNNLLTKQIWALAFAASFLLMALSLSALKLNGEDVMLSAGQFNWYYFLYVFSALTVAIGVINMWIYRRQLWQLCRKSAEDSKE